MDKSNFDMTLDELQNNKHDCSEKGQNLDVTLITQLLRLKYNSEERLQVINLLEQSLKTLTQKYQKGKHYGQDLHT